MNNEKKFNIFEFVKGKKIVKIRTEELTYRVATEDGTSKIYKYNPMEHPDAVHLGGSDTPDDCYIVLDDGSELHFDVSEWGSISVNVLKECRDCYPHPRHEKGKCEYCLCGRDDDKENEIMKSDTNGKNNVGF